MTDEQNISQNPSAPDQVPSAEGNNGAAQTPAQPPVDAAPPTDQAPPVDVTPAQPAAPPGVPEDAGYGERLERLGGEPAPVITPEEFARLQRMGQVNIDARGRVRTTRRTDAEAGVSLRKRRAWYGD